MTSPPVSVVIPCFNQGRFLREALESVRAQTVRPREVVVVDDGSADDTAAVADGFPGVVCVRQANRGLAEARNRGVAATTGEYLVFLDADDRLCPDALSAGLEALSARPGAALTFGRCTRIDERGVPLHTVAPPLIEGDAYAALLRNNPIWTPAVAMFRRSVCAPWLRFDAALSAAADYDLYLRIARRAPIHGHDRVVAEYRLHGASMSADAALMLRSTVRALRAQRRHVREHPERRRAHEEGLRSYRHHYGQLVVGRILSEWRQPRRWRALLRDGAALLRYHPSGVLRGTGRGLQRIVWRRRPAAARRRGAGVRA